jgi:putative transcriptional regulator
VIKIRLTVRLSKIFGFFISLMWVDAFYIYFVSNLRKPKDFQKVYIVKLTLRIVSFTCAMALTKNNLRNFRKKAGLSQEKLADKVSVTRQTIISIENGKYVPSLELALKFAKQFKCKVENLFGV